MPVPSFTGIRNCQWMCSWARWFITCAKTCATDVVKICKSQFNFQDKANEGVLKTKNNRVVGKTQYSAQYPFSIKRCVPYVLPRFCKQLIELVHLSTTASANCPTPLTKRNSGCFNCSLHCRALNKEHHTSAIHSTTAVTSTWQLRPKSFCCDCAVFCHRTNRTHLRIVTQT